MRDRIRPDQNLKRMKIARPDGCRLRPHPRPLRRRNSFQRMIQRRENVGAGARRRIERDHLGIDKGKFGMKPAFQQFADQRNLRPYYGNRRVVNAAILAHFRVIDRQKILIEIQPGIAAHPLTRQRHRVHRANHSLQHLRRRFDLGPRLLIGQDFQRLGQQTVLRTQGLGRLRGGQFHRAGPAGQQQRIGQGLRVSIGELRIIGVGKQVMPPVHRQRRETRIGILHRRQHLDAQ